MSLVSIRRLVRVSVQILGACAAMPDPLLHSPFVAIYGGRGTTSPALALPLSTDSQTAAKLLLIAAGISARLFVLTPLPPWIRSGLHYSQPRI